MPTAANAGYYAKIVRETAVLRRLIEAGTKIVQLGYTGDGDADDIVDAAQVEVYNVTDRRTSEDYVPLSAIMEGTLDEIEAIGSRGGEMVGVPTGFADFDELTNGLHPGQMIVVAARPAVGKSTLGLDVARSAAIKNNMATVHLLPGDEPQRDHDATALGRGAGSAAPHAHRQADRRRLDPAGPPDGRGVRTRRCSSTTHRTCR